ncbi:MAG: hypothetical protein AAFR38_07340 [Planctomycetota bacterium]
MRTARRGFTLMELMSSIGVSSVAIFGIAASITLASRTIPTSDDRLTRRLEVAQALELMRADALVAQEITFATSGIQMAVPDRNGDGALDVVRYLPHTRFSNGVRTLVRVDADGKMVELVEGVRELTFGRGQSLDGAGFVNVLFELEEGFQIESVVELTQRPTNEIAPSSRDILVPTDITAVKTDVANVLGN